MASYIDSILLRGEQVQYRCQLHWVIYLQGMSITVAGWLLSLGWRDLAPLLLGGPLPPYADGFFPYVNAGIVIIGLLALVRAFIQQISTELAVTSRRVIAKTGFIARQTHELFLEKVEGANIEQSVLGRMLGFGSVHVKGTGGGISPIDNIADPRRFQAYVLEQMNTRTINIEASAERLAAGLNPSGHD